MHLHRSRVRVIAVNEVRRHRRSGRLIWAMGLLFTLAVASVAASGRDYRRLTAANARETLAERERWLAQGTKRPLLAGDQGVVVFQPVPPLSIFDSGVLPYVGSAAHLDADEERLFTGRSAEYANSLRHLGPFTPAALMLWLLPLVVVLFGADAIAGERAGGTLAQSAAAGASGLEVIAGKAAGVAAAAAASIAPATLIVGAACLVSASAGERGDASIRLAAVAVSCMAYIGVWICAVVAISSVARAPQAAWLALIALWFVECGLAPRVAADVSSAITASPSAFEFATRQMEALTQIPTLEEHRADVRRRLLAEHHVASLRDLPVDPIGVEMLEYDQYEQARIHPIIAGLYDAIEAQDRLVARLGWIAPALALRSISMRVVGTDFHAHRVFAVAANAYRRAFAHTLFVAVRDHPAYRSSPVFPGTDIIVTPGWPALWASVPAFTYQAEPAPSVIGSQRPEIAALAAWLSAALVMLVWSGSRLRVSP